MFGTVMSNHLHGLVFDSKNVRSRKDHLGPHFILQMQNQRPRRQCVLLKISNNSVVKPGLEPEAPLPKLPLHHQHERDCVYLSLNSYPCQIYEEALDGGREKKMTCSNPRPAGFHWLSEFTDNLPALYWRPTYLWSICVSSSLPRLQTYQVTPPQTLVFTITPSQHGPMCIATSG